MTVRYQIGVNKSWPFEEIFYVPARASTPILFECAMEIPFLAAGRFCSPAEALADQGLLLQLQAEWFIPLLRRMADGEDVSLAEIQQAHEAARGSPLPQIDDPRQLAK